MSLLGIHLGEAGVEVLVVDRDGAPTAGARRPVTVDAPRPGWAELAPDEVWRATLAATGEVLDAVGAGVLTALGVADADDVLVLWDRETLGTPRPALAPADRRAGLTLAGRLRWLAAHEPRTWELVASGEYAVGGLASYLVARLTRGTWHVADATQAARTGLLDAASGRWSEAACAAAGVPPDALPEIVAGPGVLDRTDGRSFLGLDLPVAGLATEGAAAALGRGDAARGAAYLAGLGTGVWDAPSSLPG